MKESAIDHELIHLVSNAKYYETHKLLDSLSALDALFKERKHIANSFIKEKHDASQVKELFDMNKTNIHRLLGIGF